MYQVKWKLLRATKQEKWSRKIKSKQPASLRVFVCWKKNTRSQRTVRIWPILPMKSSMKKVVSYQLPIIWCISICMDKAKLSVSIMGSKPAVNATKRRKMAHGNAKPSTAKGLWLSNQLSRQVPLLCMQTQIACNQTRSASLQVRRTKQNALY